ncbi:MAG: hypothetical protein ACI9R3_001542 [Verrucomicrobiales bacterium]|jgi:hypothetical protein
MRDFFQYLGLAGDSSICRIPHDLQKLKGYQDFPAPQRPPRPLLQTPELQYDFRNRNHHGTRHQGLAHSDPRRVCNASKIPAAAEWFLFLKRKSPNTYRAYVNDWKEFVAFVGIQDPEEFGDVKRVHGCWGASFYISPFGFGLVTALKQLILRRSTSSAFYKIRVS